MKTLTRYAVPLAALLGLTVALAPAAGASPARPGNQSTTKTVTVPSTFTVTSPCNHWTVSTAGVATLTITTDGRHSVVRLFDAELGDGYTFTESGVATFNHRHHSYSVQLRGIWFNDELPARSFHGWISAVVHATHRNAPVSFTATVESTWCGLGH
jgi:hypothetical protein